MASSFPWTWPRAVIPASVRGSWAALRGVLHDGIYGKPWQMTTKVDMQLARSLYRNDHPDFNLGAGFVRPIIDLSVEYMALPYVTSDDGKRDTYLNQSIHDHWAAALQQAFTAMLRDSKAVVRFRQPRIDNPLFTEDDRMHGRIDVIPPELVDITFDPSDGDLIERAVVYHWIQFDERTDAEILEGVMPRWKEHEIWEIITADEYRFYDKTENAELISWRTPNTWRFVPLWPGYNEYDATIGGGQSDIEPVMPFIKAFHDVLADTLRAHKYHSIPKAKFNLKDVTSFLANNYPEVLDESTGKIKPGAKVSWSGKEIFFFNSEEDAGFIEATSVLGDSKTLLEFLIDCIAIASETPKWALLKTEGNANDPSLKTFEKKIARKRTMTNPLVQMVCKMALASRGQRPVTVGVSWPAISIETLVSKGQAIQQLGLAFDVFAAHEWMADGTIIQILSTIFDEISDPETEKRLAANNVVVDAAPAPASETQATNGNGNGGGSRSRARRAVATATGRNS